MLCVRARLQTCRNACHLVLEPTSVGDAFRACRSAGAEARLCLRSSARLKSCPDTKQDRFIRWLLVAVLPFLNLRPRVSQRYGAVEDQRSRVGIQIGAEIEIG